MAKQERNGAAHRIVTYQTHDYSGQQQSRSNAPMPKKRAQQVARIEQERSGPAFQYAQSQIKKR